MTPWMTHAVGALRSQRRRNGTEELCTETPPRVLASVHSLRTAGEAEDRGEKELGGGGVVTSSPRTGGSRAIAGGRRRRAGDSGAVQDGVWSIGSSASSGRRRHRTNFLWQVVAD